MKLRLCAALAAIVFSSIGATAQAASASADRSYQFTTRIVAEAPSSGEFDGTLQLTVSPGGIVSGYYRPNDERFVPVSGGLTGDALWLDIGAFGPRPLHFSGTLEDGRIDAGAFRGGTTLHLEAQPARRTP